MALPLAVVLALGGPTSTQGRKLNGPLAYTYTSGVGEFVLGAGGRFVYEAAGGGSYSIRSASLDGGPSVQLFANQPTDLLTATSDGTRVVFRAGSVNHGVAELYSARVDGSEPAIRVHPALGADEDVHAFRLSPDGSSVVYVQYTEELNPQGQPVLRFRLRCAPVDGSQAPITLTPALQSRTDFVVTPDSQRVVFLGYTTDSGRSRLCSVPLSGGSAPVQLSPTANISNILAFRLAADGSRAVYRFARYQSSRWISELFSAPVDGSSPAVTLNDPLPVGGEVMDFRINGSRPPVNLSGAHGSTLTFEISPDGTRVVFAAGETA